MLHHKHLKEEAAAQRHHLRCILGVQLSDRLSNEDLLQRCQQPTIAAQLHQWRGHWIGHVLRMVDGRIAKLLFYSNLAGDDKAVQVPCEPICRRCEECSRHPAAEGCSSGSCCQLGVICYTYIPDIVPNQGLRRTSACSFRAIAVESINQSLKV